MFYTLITGASSGIGWEMAQILAEKKENLILVARRVERMIPLKEDLESRFGISIFIFDTDLSIWNNCGKLFDSIQQNNLKVNKLINNAGFGLAGEFENLDISRLHAMVNLNCASLMELSHHFAKYWKNNKISGSILNVASIAGYYPGPYMTVYYASKAFVKSFSLALFWELKEYNIHVSCLCPGATKTEFDTVSGLSSLPLFTNLKLMSGKEVALLGLESHDKKRKIIVTGLKNKLFSLFSRIIPMNLQLLIISKLQKKD